MKKRCLSIMAALLLVLSLFAGIAAKDVRADGNTDVRNSVAVVYTCLDVEGYGEQGFGWGTGFFVGDTKKDPEYLVTNYHVISDFVQYGGGENSQFTLNDGTVITGKAKIKVFFDSEDSVEAYLVEGDSTKDIAILKLDTPTSKRKAITLISPTEDMVGSQVQAVGYPGLAENVFTDAASKWSMTDASVTGGNLSRLLTKSGTGIKYVQIDVKIQHGNSGGPLVNSKGSVLGVNTLGVSEDGETNYYAVNIDEVIPMLKKNDVPYKMQGQGGVSMLFILIGVGAVVLIGLIVLVIVLATKGSKKSAPAASAPVNKPENIPVQTPVAPAPKNPYVRSMAAQHNGMRFQVKGQATLGRSADCLVIFKEGTPGVSGRHCTISWDPATGDFLLTDMKSTYGTFLMNGQKLTPGAPYRLKSGDSFYLGENTNVLRVELE